MVDLNHFPDFTPRSIVISGLDLMHTFLPFPLISGHYSMEQIGSACQDAWNGLPSQRPVMEMTIPSSLDKTLSPPGK